MNRTTAVLAALLCISVGFSVGQATDQSAEAGSSNRPVLKKLDRIQFRVNSIYFKTGNLDPDVDQLKREIGERYPNDDFSGNTPATGLRGAVANLQQEMKDTQRLLGTVCRSVAASVVSCF